MLAALLPRFPQGAAEVVTFYGEGPTGLAGGLALGFHPACSSAALRSTLLLSALIGTVYSTGPRLKRFPLFAALCILTVRGAVVNIGYVARAKSTSWRPLC